MRTVCNLQSFETALHMQLLVCFCKTILIIFTYQLGFLENVCCLVKGSSSHHGPYGPPRDLYIVCKGPKQNDRELGCHSNLWVGHWNFTAWINISNLKLNQRFPSALYPQQHKRQICILLVFPTPYLDESGFIWVTFAVKACNCFDVKRGDLYLSLTTPQLNVYKLASVYQVQETPWK